MKTIIIIIISLYFINASAQSWQWTNSGGGLANTTIDYVADICTDNNGNTYITGTVQGPNAFFKTDTIPVNGLSDIFVAKYDASGNELWVKCFGGPYFSTTILDDEGGRDILFDSITNTIYFTGRYVGFCTFDADTLTGFDINTFLVRMDLNGNCIWANNISGQGDQGSSTMDIDGFGIIHICGWSPDTALIDGLSLNPGTYFARFDSSGTCLNAKKIMDKSGVSDIKLQAGEIFCLVGKNSDSLLLDTSLLIDTNGRSSILAKFDSAGNLLWSKVIAESGVSPINIEFDSTGSAYFICTLTDSIAVFGVDTIILNQSTSLGKNGLLVKYDSNFDFQWAKTSTSSNLLFFRRMSTDNYGNSYITGFFTGNAVFDSIPLVTSGADLFVMKYNAAGNLLGIVNESGARSETVLTLPDGSCVIGGIFYDTLQLGNNTLVSHGDYDILVAKLDAITGIEEYERIGNESLVIYANPNQGKCRILVPKDFVNENKLTLRIYNVSGRLLQQREISLMNETISLNLEAEARGIYNVILSGSMRSYSGKIIFE